MLCIDQMSQRATLVNLIRYQWFVFRIGQRFWLQDKNRHTALKHVGSRHQIPDEQGFDGDVKDSPGSCYKISEAVGHSLKYRRTETF